MIKKINRYQDYVIKDGSLIGEFEEMYKAHEDPWEQSTRESYATEKNIALQYCKKLNSDLNGGLKVIELGCGLGYYSNQLSKAGLNVLGTDVSLTAINKARSKFQDVKFVACDILDYHVYDEFCPDVFIMAEITWYVLEKLEEFLKYLKSNHRHARLIHLLNTYPSGQQRYGCDYFTNIEEILNYFNLRCIEYGTVINVQQHDCVRTYFISSLDVS